MPKKSLLKCYFGCTVDGPLHRFPKWDYPFEEKFQSWKAVLSSATQGYDNTYIYNNIRLCYRHFEKCFQLPYLTLAGHVQVRNTSNLSSTELQEEAVNISTQEQVVSSTPRPSTAATSSSSNPEVFLNVSKKKCKPIGISGPSLVTSHRPIPKGLHKKIDALQQTITKLRKKCKTQAKGIRMAEKISKSKIFLEVVEKLPEPIKIFTTMQLKHSKKARGRKYSLKEKILSLTILKQSPKGYNLLRKLVVLPSKRTLQKLLSFVVLKPGINSQVIEDFKKSVKKLPMEKRLCSLIFDEVSLAPGLYYNDSIKEIVGFEDFGYKKTKKIADHALVLMIKSIKGKFKQPICFTFCQSATKKEDLKVLIKDSIKAISSTGLKIICTVCDQSPTNVSTIKSLHEDTVQEYIKKGEEFKSDSFEIGGVKIYRMRVAKVFINKVLYAFTNWSLVGFVFRTPLLLILQKKFSRGS